MAFDLLPIYILFITYVSAVKLHLLFQYVLGHRFFIGHQPNGNCLETFVALSWWAYRETERQKLYK